MVGNVAKSQTPNELFELVGGTIIDCEFDELDSETFQSRRHLRNIGNRLPAFRAQLIHQINQRTLPIDSDRTRRTGAELVIENLQ